MNAVKLNDNWKFWKDGDSFALFWDFPQNAETVNLPHDAMIFENAKEDSPNANNTGFRNGGNYVYSKMISVPHEWKDKTVMVKFEGIYMNALVYVNEQLAAKRPYGYSGFYVKLDDYLKYGEENEIRVKVKNGAMSNSRWYSGSGIYRDVYLLTADKSYIKPDGIRVKTENADDDFAVLNIKADIINSASYKRNLKLVTEVFSAENETVCKSEKPFVLFSSENKVIENRLTVEKPSLWSAENPYLYTVRFSLYDGETLIDSHEEKTGIRTLSLDAKRGLRVNGKTVKLRGGCIHHDNGVLGAKEYYESEYRRVKIMKEAGFNAIRMAHHPASPALLKACDELGMYVMDEGFDMWTRNKTDYDYSLWFTEWYEQDIKDMIIKDYNHPSVVLYSIGNEIPEIGNDEGTNISYNMNKIIKEIDDTRFTLIGINGAFAAGNNLGRIIGEILARENGGGNVNNFMTAMDSHWDEIAAHEVIGEILEKANAHVDVCGYNYMTARYENDSKKYPDRVMVGSETYPPQIARNWRIIKANPAVIGDFTWTGWDYMGESGGGIPAYSFGEGGFGAKFPAQLSYGGDIDILGHRRPMSHRRERVFGLNENPYICVKPPVHYGEKQFTTPWVDTDTVENWTWSGYEGKPVIVEVYSMGDEVELYKNGVSLGRKTAGDKADYRVLFETTYEEGELKAVAYGNGKVIGESVLASSGKAVKISLTSDFAMNDISYINLQLTDEKGMNVNSEDYEFTVEASGAEILGLGSANPCSLYPYVGNKNKTFEGRAQVVIKKTDKEALIKVSSSLGETEIKL